MIIYNSANIKKYYITIRLNLFYNYLWKILKMLTILNITCIVCTVVILPIWELVWPPSTSELAESSVLAIQKERVLCLSSEPYLLLVVTSQIPSHPPLSVLSRCFGVWTKSSLRGNTFRPLTGLFHTGIYIVVSLLNIFIEHVWIDNRFYLYM